MNSNFNIGLPTPGAFAWTVAFLAASVASSQDLATFQRDALLQRFDRDGNGKLDARETAKLRQAFGGIDVPVLPSKPFDYATRRFPKHLDLSKL
ncbi:MAG: hypothetical protein N2C14_28350, partial [Planctomycetales bacterium]